MVQHEFTCQHCGERIVVDDAVVDLLLEEGCVYCGDDVTHEAFSNPVH